MPWNVPAQVSASVIDRRVAAEHLAGDALDALGHLRCGAAREGHQQDAARIGAVDDQMRDAVGQRVGLAGAGAGDDQQRPGDAAVAMLDGQALLGIELGEIGGLEGRITGGEVHRGMKHRFRFVRNAFVTCDRCVRSYWRPTDEPKLALRLYAHRR